MSQFGNILFSIIFDGLAYAMILFIISVGLSITMGLMGFVNLAHGAFAMAGGYFAVSLMTTLGVGFIPALFLAAVAVGIASLARGAGPSFRPSAEVPQSTCKGAAGLASGTAMSWC